MSDIANEVRMGKVSAAYAAKEIERLTAELERMTAELKLYRTGEAYSLAAERISDMEAVLKRLSILPVGSLDSLEGVIAAVHIIASEGLTD